MNSKPDLYEVLELHTELLRIKNMELEEGSLAYESIERLLGCLIIDYAECGCQVEINMAQQVVTIDECEDHDNKFTVLRAPVEEAVEAIKDGRHLLSCPKDQYCRCQIEIMKAAILEAAI